MAATQHPSCPMCNNTMFRIYERIRDPETGRQQYYSCGWKCSNPGCRFVTLD